MEEHYYTEIILNKRRRRRKQKQLLQDQIFPTTQVQTHHRKTKNQKPEPQFNQKGGKNEGMGMRRVRSARGGTWRGWGCRCGGEGRRRCGGGSWPQGWGGGRCCSGTPPPSTWSPCPPLPASRGNPPAPTAPPPPPPSPLLAGILPLRRRRRSRLLGQPRAATRPPKLKLRPVGGIPC